MLSGLSTTQKGIFLAICGFSAFSVSDASCKWLAQSYSVSAVIAYTSLFSVLCGLALSPLLGGIGRTIKTPKLKFHTGRGIANVFIAFLVVNAFAHLPLATAYTVLFLTPFIVTLLAIPVHGEKVNLKSWLIIGAGFSGILVAFPPGTGGYNIWIFAAFGASFFVALLGLLARKLGPEETVLSLSFYPSLFSTLVYLPLALWGGDWPALADLPLFILAGIMVTTGLSCIASAFRIAPYAVVSPFNYLQMIWALIFGALVFADVPEAHMLLGAGIIVGSGLALVMTERKGNAQASPSS
ncbi:MAG: DMT family transporter [Alphaproteobacteria bacterium]|nr:DMT family transporter [Alphaproteobacteria bacterium]MBP7759053.1 DMT family transporter [Alphaproteobacteria bacterium]MBP7762327.1 DMT family transporter [Alphaproteobacteria bacterium]